MEGWKQNADTVVFYSYDPALRAILTRWIQGISLFASCLFLGYIVLNVLVLVSATFRVEKRCFDTGANSESYGYGDWAAIGVNAVLLLYVSVKSRQWKLHSAQWHYLRFFYTRNKSLLLLFCLSGILLGAAGFPLNGGVRIILHCIYMPCALAWTDVFILSPYVIDKQLTRVLIKGWNTLAVISYLTTYFTNMLGQHSCSTEHASLAQTLCAGLAFALFLGASLRITTLLFHKIRDVARPLVQFSGSTTHSRAYNSDQPREQEESSWSSICPDPSPKTVGCDVQEADFLDSIVMEDKRKEISQPIGDDVPSDVA